MVYILILSLFMNNNFISSVWKFENKDKDGAIYKTHNFLRWYGKLPSELVSKLITLYSKDKDLVLANFSGSGTIPLECLINNRDCYAVDSNPLAVILSDVKSHPFSLNTSKIIKLLEDFLKKKSKKSVKNDYEKKWFKENSILEVKLIKDFIDSYDGTKKEKKFLLLILASIIKKVSLVDSRCINHIVLDKDKNNPNTFSVFKEKLQLMGDALKDLKKQINHEPKIDVMLGDARKIDLPDNSVKLIISHPPYLGNVDYTNINQLENYILGHSYEDIRNSDLSTNNLEKYLNNMNLVINEMNRLIEKDGKICLIIGDNRKDNQIIPTFSYFIKHATSLGLKLEDIFIWVLNQKAGMSIKRHGNHIDHNYILVFRK